MEQNENREMPTKYADIIDQMCEKIAALQPPYTFIHLHITVRPRGSRMQFRKEIPFRLFFPNRERGEAFLKDIALDLLQKAERVFKGKELIIELTTDKDETVLGIRKNLARQAKTALQRPPLKAVVKPVPKPTPKAKPKPKPDPQPAPEPQSPPQKREVLQSRHDPAALINYDSMYHYRTDGTPRIIKSVFRNLEITTGNDVLELLGTTSPTEGEWDAFIRTIRRRAKAKNLNFGPSSEGTLYWWLTRKMGWIKPYHKR